MINPAVDLRDLHPELDMKVAELSRHYSVPGAAVGVQLAEQNDICTHGVTSLENPSVVTADTLFQVGSISKVFTATALMVLCERKLVDLSDPVVRYLPELPANVGSAEALKVLHLLNHTAGWDSDKMDLAPANISRGEQALGGFVTTTLSDAELVNIPGSVASFNNTGITVAGRIIETVTGMVFEHAMYELLIAPLGLAKTFYFAEEAITECVAIGHKRDRDQITVARPWALPRCYNPTGGIVTTIKDLLAFGRFHAADGGSVHGNQVLPGNALKMMRSPTATLPAPAAFREVGIGWLLRRIEGVTVAGHGGLTAGQSSCLRIVPDREFVLSIMGNSGDADAFIADLEQWILARYLNIHVESPQLATLPKEELAPYVGTYDMGIAVLEVTTRGSRLVFTMVYTAEGLRKARAALRCEPPAPKPFEAVVLAPGDRFMLCSGPGKGLRGNVLRTVTGTVSTLVIGGRPAVRRAR